MATSRVRVDAPVAAVYESLLDPWTYEAWVRGTKRIRGVDPEWPAAGSRFHHTVGIAPLMTRDETRLLRADPERGVELEVHTWPAGEALVRIDLAPAGEGTDVTLHEQPIRGAVALLDNRLQQRLVELRNDSSLRKLKKIVEQRWRMRR